MALNKPSKLFVQWHPNSPVQDVTRLLMACKKLFQNVTSLTADDRRVIIQTSYTSSDKKINEKLEPFAGNVRWHRAGPLNETEEAEVDDLFRELAGTPRKSSKPPTKRTSKKRKIVESESDESEVESEEPKPKRKQYFKKRNDPDDFVDDDTSK